MKSEFERQTAFGVSAVLTWAADAGVFRFLAVQPRSTASLASELKCDVHALGLVLNVLRVSGWIEPEGERYRLTGAISRDHLEHEVWMWNQLGSFVRSGESLVADEARDVVYPNVVSYLGRRFAPDAEALAPQLTEEARTILDVGAGSGVWSLAMGALVPNARVTALDGPRTLEIFRLHAERAHMLDRVDLLPGNYHEVELPNGEFDRAVLANVLHLETPERAQKLVSRTARALTEHGCMVIVDAVADAPEEHRLGIAVYALHLGLRVPGSKVYSKAELEDLVDRAGLNEHRWIALSRGLWALVARRA